MPTLISQGSPEGVIDERELYAHLDHTIATLAMDVKKLLLLPPDQTRIHSQAGKITAYLYRQLKARCQIKIMPALGTHAPMSKEQLEQMFGREIPLDVYLPHDWRHALKTLGEIPASRIRELSEGRLETAMQIAVNKELIDGGYDLILSIGQIVPHEVVGMANYTKNVLIGVGGEDIINVSHYLSAVYGMERIMGETINPVRLALNEGYDRFIRPRLKVFFILTVVDDVQKEMVLRGLYVGDDQDTFVKACELSRMVNIETLPKPVKKCIVFLDPQKFNSTWLGNKAIYRTRKAMADNGELIILAPGVHTFGEDAQIDCLIRKYGYRGTEETMREVAQKGDLSGDLSAAAHLIHGTVDGRFKITYCPGPSMTKAEIEDVGFSYLPYDGAVREYPPDLFEQGWNTVKGEKVFYIGNPSLGLWRTLSNA